MTYFRALFFLFMTSLVSPALAQVGTCTNSKAQAILDAGNVRASILNTGSLYWGGSETRRLYEVPKGTGVHSMFASTFNVGGFIDGDLHMAASTFGPYEFWAGPLDEKGNPPPDCSAYDKIWEIRTEDFEQVELFGTFSWNMRNWPWELGAPVVDGDGNSNNYNLEGGDRPELLGDQTLWWIMNDRGNTHEWSEAHPIGLEVRVSVFAFDHDGSAGDMTFYRYLITNKNNSALTDTYLSIWSDADLGNASDDYVGSDSLLHLGYVYNGFPIDENGYGDRPPAAGYTFLVTPEAEPDEIDNDYDGVIDEPGEQTGTYAATYFPNSGGNPGPFRGLEMYRYMQGLWIDRMPFTYGGDARTYSSIPTRFIFTGSPEDRTFWTEIVPFPGGRPIPPSDRRFMVSAGPFTLDSGETTEFLTALVWAQGQDYLDSVRKLKGIVSTMQAAPTSFLASGYRPGLVEPPPAAPEFVLGFDQNYPNPFSSWTRLRYSLPKTMRVRITIYDLLGREIAVVAEGSKEAGVYSEPFDGTFLVPGIYYARIEMDHLSFTRKLVRIP